MSENRSNSNTFATIEKFVETLSPSEKVSVYKVHKLARAGKIPIYKLPGIKSACVNVGEAHAVLAKLTAQGKIRRGYGTFGPDAIVRDFTMIAEGDFEVIQ